MFFLQHLKDIVHIRRADAAMLQKLPGWREEGGAAPNGGEDEADTTLVLPRDRCLAVVRGLMALLLSMDFTCHVDLFLVACKVGMASNVGITMSKINRTLVQGVIVNMDVKTAINIFVQPLVRAGTFFVSCFIDVPGLAG